MAVPVICGGRKTLELELQEVMGLSYVGLFLWKSISSFLGKACRKLINSENTTYAKKKKKSTQTMFPFLFDVSKCKKVKILTPVRMRPQDHAKRFFLFCFLQCGWQLDDTCLVGKCHFFTKAPTQGGFYFSASQSITSLLVFVCVLLGRHMELKNLAA